MNILPEYEYSICSRKLDNVLSKVLKKKSGMRNNDEATLLRDGSNDSF